MKLRRSFLFALVVLMIFTGVSCGNNPSGDENTQISQGTEDAQETETETRIVIIDASDILTTVWEEYTERFDIMGGHFETAVIGMPAKYDLTQTVDLVQMYCVPENEVQTLDDAATMINLYNAGAFTAGAFHVSDVEQTQSFIEGIESQVSINQWHGEKPEKLLIIEIEEQYVVSVYGREVLVNEFKQKLLNIYSKMATVAVEQIIP